MGRVALRVASAQFILPQSDAILSDNPPHLSETSLGVPHSSLRGPPPAPRNPRPRLAVLHAGVRTLRWLPPGGPRLSFGLSPD